MKQKLFYIKNVSKTVQDKIETQTKLTDGVITLISVRS